MANVYPFLGVSAADMTTKLNALRRNEEMNKDDLWKWVAFRAYERRGFCPSNPTPKTIALTEAERRIKEAKRDTPESVRHLFLSYLTRTTKGGYEWGWVMKDSLR